MEAPTTTAYDAQEKEYMEAGAPDVEDKHLARGACRLGRHPPSSGPNESSRSRPRSVNGSVTSLAPTTTSTTTSSTTTSTEIVLEVEAAQTTRKRARFVAESDEGENVLPTKIASNERGRGSFRGRRRNRRSPYRSYLLSQPYQELEPTLRLPRLRRM
ncbi:hypothetical protein BKA66DRAFT_443205 [Pyrenochaeta sp. MPI-SDFR-AT-0127]|nr:hypothetical protein BKA66DRAFT_443205 [Pyrenochaeta sp. MPI-SDFR-AT-0127]